MLYPLRFQPLFKRHLWGGRRLHSDLGKSIGPGDDYAESWEIVDHGADQSVVVGGPLAGATLHELVSQYGVELFGQHPPQTYFPLLWKFLDANKVLSVQVHPDDERAAKLDPPDLGKTEAWVILAASPGSVLYAGLKPGYDRSALEREIARGTSHLGLHQIEPRVGDCIYLPAGTVHALGDGLVIAEIQQASDTTYRLYDWDRVGPNGKPRPLHIEQGLDAIDFDRGPVHPQTPQATDRDHVQRLVSSDKFVLDRWQLTRNETIPDDERFHIIAVIDGEFAVEGDPIAGPMTKGQTILVPAAVGETRIHPTSEATLLVAYLP